MQISILIQTKKNSPVEYESLPEFEAKSPSPNTNEYANSKIES